MNLRHSPHLAPRSNQSNLRLDPDKNDFSPLGVMPSCVRKPSGPTTVFVKIPGKISRWEYLSGFLDVLSNRRSILVLGVEKKTKVMDLQRQTLLLCAPAWRRIVCKLPLDIVQTNSWKNKISESGTKSDRICRTTKGVCTLY